MLLPSSTRRAVKEMNAPLCVLTCYDFPTARRFCRSGVDILLIGDSVGTNVLGYSDVTQVTMADMVHHTAAVARGAGECFVLADMPFGSFATPERALSNARALIAAGADGVKIEGEQEALSQIKAVTDNGITVCGHIGYTPQTDGAKATVQGKDFDRAVELITIAVQVQQAGASLLVLELIPQELAGIITSQLTIPTIGIGAGNRCSGQVQVMYDILGLSQKTYRHAHVFADTATPADTAVQLYCSAVRQGTFPTEQQAAHLDTLLISDIERWVSGHATEARA